MSKWLNKFKMFAEPTACSCILYIRPYCMFFFCSYLQLLARCFKSRGLAFHSRQSFLDFDMFIKDNAVLLTFRRCEGHFVLAAIDRSISARLPPRNAAMRFEPPPHCLWWFYGFYVLKVLRLPRKSKARSYEALRLPNSSSKSWRFQLQKYNRSHQIGALTFSMIISKLGNLGPAAKIEMHLFGQSSKVPSLPTFLKFKGAEFLHRPDETHFRASKVLRARPIYVFRLQMCFAPQLHALLSAPAALANWLSCPAATNIEKPQRFATFVRFSARAHSSHRLTDFAATPIFEQTHLSTSQKFFEKKHPRNDTDVFRGRDV